MASSRLSLATTLPIVAVGAVWLTAGLTALALALATLLQSDTPIALAANGPALLGGLVAAVLGLALVRRRPWVRPAAAILHFWLVLACWGAVIWLRPYPNLLHSPLWPAALNWDDQSREYLVTTILLTAGLFCLGLAFWFGQRRRQDSFAAGEVPARDVCPVCASDLEPAGGCAHCAGRNKVVEFYLQLVIPGQPSLPGIRRILLYFEPGHWNIAIGRGVPRGDAYLDGQLRDGQRRPIFGPISRYHAQIRYDPNSDTLHIAPEGIHRVLVNGKNVGTGGPVAPGDLIALENLDYRVYFLLGRESDRPQALELVDVESRRSAIFCLSQRKPSYTIGRAGDNDYVVEPRYRGVANYHARLSYDGAYPDYLYLSNRSIHEDSLKVNNALVPHALPPDLPGEITEGSPVPIALNQADYVDLDLDNRQYRLIIHRYRPEERQR